MDRKREKAEARQFTGERRPRGRAKAQRQSKSSATEHREKEGERAQRVRAVGRQGLVARESPALVEGRAVEAA